MGNTDDLEDFDAELEITLKKEYAAVFGLFTYCVITQEATYLCNQLRVECAPSSGYLLFDIRMEDVWVWDRNRPTRIIPRAQVYTTADVTVEQLRDAPQSEFDAAVPKDVVAGIRAAALALDGDDGGSDDSDERRGSGDDHDAIEVEPADEQPPSGS